MLGTILCAALAVSAPMSTDCTVMEVYDSRECTEQYPTLRSRDEKKVNFTEKWAPVIRAATYELAEDGIHLNQTATLARFALSTGWAESRIWRDCRNPAGMYYGATSSPEYVMAAGFPEHYVYKDPRSQYACFRTDLDFDDAVSDTEREIAAGYVAFSYYGRMLGRGTFCNATSRENASSPYTQAWYAYVGGWSRQTDDSGALIAYQSQVSMFSSWVTPDEPVWIREAYETARLLPSYAEIKANFCENYATK